MNYESDNDDENHDDSTHDKSLMSTSDENIRVLRIFHGYLVHDIQAIKEPFLLLSNAW